jgi:hypothetical protein
MYVFSSSIPAFRESFANEVDIGQESDLDNTAFASGNCCTGILYGCTGVWLVESVKGVCNFMEPHWAKRGI